MPGQFRTLSKYRLIAKLGGGGMADAYLGVVSAPDGFNKLYVLKVLRSDVDEREKAELLSMFQDEGRLAARLNHPHIVQSYEMGCDDGQHFIAMEFLEGQPFSLIQERWSEDENCFPLALRLFVIGQLLDGLDYAHNLVDYDGRHLSIVHRDVSPQNVFVTYAGHTKLLDFGIAKTQRSQKTRAGIVKGKIPYMAPEQVRGAELDPRADLFSAGVVLWECIANRPFHTDQNEYDILKRLAEGRFPRLREVVSDVPPLLERIVSRALAFDPKHRYPDARTFREELLSVPEVRAISSRDVAQRLDALFADNRKLIAETIRDAISVGPGRDSSPPTQTALPFLPTAHTRTGARAPISTTSPTTAVVSEVPAPAESSPLPLEKAPASPRFSPVVLRVGSAGAVITAAALGVFSLTQRPRPPEPNALASAPKAPLAPPSSTSLAPPSAPLTAPTPAEATPLPPAATPSSAASPEKAAAALIQLSISVKPSSAVIVLDGERVSQNPLREARARDGSSHTLKLSAAGYKEQTLKLTFDADIAKTIELTRVTAQPRSEPSWVSPKLPERSSAPARPTGRH